MEPNFHHIGKRIKEIRNLRQKSQAKLAEEVNLSEAYISHIETARKQVSLTAILSISCALEVPLEAILFGEKSYDPKTFTWQLMQLFNDCNINERRFIYEMTVSLKESVRRNQWLQTVSRK